MLNVECEKDIYNLLDRIDIEKGKNYYKNYIEYIDCDEKNDITTHSFLVESERTYDYYNVEVIVKDNHIVDQSCDCPQHNLYGSCKHVAACILNYQDDIYQITKEEKEFQISKYILDEFYRPDKKSDIHLKKQLFLEIELTFNDGYRPSVSMTFKIGEKRLYNLNNKMLAAFASINLAGIITIIYLLIVTKIWKYISLKCVDKKLLKEMLVYSIPLIPNSLSWWIINVSDRFIIKLMLGVEANAIYAVANKIPSIYSLFYNGFNLAWQESASLDSKDNKMYYQNIFTSLSKFLMSGLLILISILPIIFKLLVIGDYNESYYQMPILCISLLFSSLSAFLGGIYIATKNSKKLGISSFMASLTNIIINFVLIKKIGLYAASFSTLVSFLILTLYRYYDIKKLCYLKINIRLLMIFILSLSIVVFGYYNKNLYFLLINIILSNSIFVIFNKEIMQAMIHKVKL